MIRSAIIVALTAISCAPSASTGQSQSTLNRIQHLETDYGKRVLDLEQIQQQLENLSERMEQINRAIAGPRVPDRPRYPGAPDPAIVYAVSIAGNPYVGPKNAKVTMVQGFEFACPYCYRVRPVLDQLQKIYGNDLKIVYKHFIVHRGQATVPARAICAAHNQGKFEAMLDLIWEKAFKTRTYGVQNMERLATEAGLQLAQFRQDMNGAACKQLVSRDQHELSAVGQRGTPGFFINGRFLSGAQPISQFRTIIDEELSKANAALRAGASLKTYYAEFVLRKGKKRL